MNITIRSFKRGRKMEETLKNLYISAFPAEERAPFRLMMSRLRKGKAEMLVAFDGEEFIGFAYTICHEGLVYLFYLAIEESKRGMGYGSLILSGIRKRYHGSRIFLAREQLDSSAPNYQQRLSRHRFYLRSGFEDLPLSLKEASVVYDVMSVGGNILPEEYSRMIKSWAGRILYSFVDMRIIEK